MQCAKCGQEVPEEAIYCPFCTGDRKVSQPAVIAGGLRGGFIGFALGALPSLVLLGIYGPVRGIKALALILPIITFATGLTIGLVRAKKDWK